MSTDLPCPRCGAPRATGPECPRCGVIYAKADARAAQDAADRVEADRRLAAQEALAASAPPTFVPPHVEALPPELAGTAFVASAEEEDEDTRGARRERLLRLVALPAALGLGFLLIASPLGAALARIFMTMLVHELGHAVTAWFCGYSAGPTLWVTHISAERSPSWIMLMAGGFAALGWQGWKRRRWGWMAAAAGLLVLQAVGTFGLSTWRAQALITFGGDAGRMVLSSALMATFYARRGSYLHRHGLRWGFLGIGAAAFMDSFHTWWWARTDVDRIPFGAIEGVGLSDPSKLVDNHGWSVGTLIDRHVGVAVACLGFLAVLYAVQLYRAHVEARG